MTLTRITKVAPRSEALIRVYRAQIILNAPASRLLGLIPGSSVNVYADKDAQMAGRNRLYVGKTKGSGFAAIKRNATYRINSSDLCKSLAEALEGFGTYRICPEDYVLDVNGDRYYNIFFRKYD